MNHPEEARGPGCLTGTKHGVIPPQQKHARFSMGRALQNEAFVYDVLCCCVVASCFFLYLHYALTHTLAYTDDFQKQYLVANHIVRFGEFPSSGDELSVFFGLHVTSPLFYYLFAFVLWVHNSILFAQVVWLSFSMLAIVCVYLVAKSLFSPLVGLFACALFGFSFAFAQQLGEAPNIGVGQAVLYLSFLLLARAFKRKNFALLLWAIAAYCVACVIYSAGFGVLPVFAVVAALTLKSQSAPPRRYLGSVALAGFTLFTAYLPVLLHAYQAHVLLLEPGLVYRFVHLPRTFLKDVFAHAVYAADSLFLFSAGGPKLPPLSDYAALAGQLLFREQALAAIRVSPRGVWATVVLCGLASSAVIAYFFSDTRFRERKRNAAILASGVAVVLLTAALFNFLYHAAWHYMAIEGLLCMLIAEAVHSAFTHLRAPRTVELVFSCSLLWCCAGGFAGISMLSDRSPGKSSASADAAGAAVVRETTALRVRRSEPYLHPQIKLFENGNELSNGVPYLCLYVENAFDERFVKMSNNVSYYPYEPVGDDRFLFVVCPHQTCPQDWRNVFSTRYKQYAIVKDVIANDAFEIVLADRI
jgi:hypothetical protein